MITLKGSEKIGLISNLATMLSAGIPILEVVNSLLEDAKGSPKIILEALKEDLTSGKRISVSFARFPRVFDPVTINVITAAETSGTLDITLKDLKEGIRKEMEFSDKVKSSLLYPIFIMIIFAAVLLLVLVVVIPKIAMVFEKLRVSLPLPTRILIFFSTVLLHYTVFVIAGVTLLVIGIIILFRIKRNVVFDLLFSFPLISTLIKEIDLTRFSRNLSLLLSSGLPIAVALELIAHVVIRRQTARILLTSRDMVMAGKTLSEGFRVSKGYFPAIMVKLVEAGEKTGTLDKSMQEISEYFDYQVTNRLKLLTSLLEPIMLVVVGIVVGGMMLAIVGPIYGLVSQVGAR
ncbi:type II secretion system F family protein [Candidatus Gottesmanbacteria bacterium]|nr:type II secretion system F family protein [Candidatus Gottesmanbacteria bacterium]